MDNSRWNPPVSATIAENPSTSSPILFRGPLPEAFLRAAEAGFSCVDFHISGASDRSLKDIGKAMGSTGLRLSAVATGGIFAKDGLSLSDEDKGIIRRAQDSIKSIIEDASQFGATVIIGIARGRLGGRGQASQEEAYKRLVESVARLASFAEEVGGILAVEAINRFESDSINNADALVRFLDEVGSAHVMANLDTYHMITEGDDIIEAILRSSGRVACFHISDLDRKCPSLNKMQLEPILRALLSTGYKGALTLEYTPCKEGCLRQTAITEDEQDLYAREGFEYLKKCITSI